MAQQPTVMPQDMIPQHPPPPQLHPPVNSYYPENPNDLTGGLPINLDSLRDGPPGSKPFYPYSTLIRYAIKGAPNQKLLLEDIYYAIESRFPYFRSAPPGWKNSVRHNLSLNPCFEKVPRPLTDRGKGSYWTVNDNVDPRTGVHRVRKKKPKGGSKGRGQQVQETQHQEEQQPVIEQDVDYHPGATTEAQTYPDPTFVPPPIIATDGPGPSRQQSYPPTYPTFDPGFGFPPTDMRYNVPPIFPPEERFEVDDHGNINWAAAWRKELANMVSFTEDQEKSGADQEWFKLMLIKVRSAMMAPPMNPGDGLGHPPNGMHGAPPNGVEVPAH